MQRVIIFGKHASIAAINNPNRIIEKILIQKEKQDNYKKILQKRVAKKIEICSAKKLDQICKCNAVHQGIAILAEPLNQPKLKDALEKIKEERSLIVILDKVVDPTNIGNILRSSMAFNVDLVVMQEKNCPSENSTIIKVASGAIEHIPICKEVNISTSIELLKKNDYFCYALDGMAEKSISEESFAHKTAFIFGAEESGIRSKIKEKCDGILKIPISQHQGFDSINVANAAVIAMYQFQSHK